jgi:hypothetical protein
MPGPTERPDRVDLARTGVRHVAHEPDARQHDRDDDDLEQERDAVWLGTW